MRERGSQYDADYFMRGKQSGKSLYEDYRWMPDLTKPMVASMVSHLHILPTDTILDFGCARGYTVRAFRETGYAAWGYDISRWALENADEVAKEYLICNESTILADSFDWIIAKDVLEHVTEIGYTVDMLMEVARKGIFIVVPLAHKKEYDVPEYELDITHVWRRPLQWWVGQFHRPGWSVTGQYRVRGVKDNYFKPGWERGNGFITCRRIED